MLSKYLTWPIETLYFIVPIFILTLFVTRRVLYTVFDPLLILTIYPLSCSLGLALFYFFKYDRPDPYTIVFLFLSHIAFTIGLRVINRIPLRIKIPHIRLRRKFMHMLLALLVLLTLAVFVAMAQTSGLIIQQKDPEMSRTTLLTGGLGIFRRVLQPSVIFGFTLLLALDFYGRVGLFSKLLLFLMFGAVMVSFASKGALVIFFQIFIYYVVYLSRNFGVKFSLRKKALAILLILLVIVVALGILFVNFKRTSAASDKEAIGFALSRFTNRMISFGDIGYYFFLNNAYLRIQKTPIDYISYVLDDILGLLRIRDYSYQMSPGAEIYAVAKNIPNLARRGPNAQTYFVGLMYFGPFGILYSFFVGCLISFLRKASLLSLSQTNLEMILFIVVNVLIVSIGTDIGLAVFHATNTFLIVGIPIFFSAWLIYSMLRFRSPLLLVRASSN